MCLQGNNILWDHWWGYGRKRTFSTERRKPKYFGVLCQINSTFSSTSSYQLALRIWHICKARHKDKCLFKFQYVWTLNHLYCIRCMTCYLHALILTGLSVLVSFCIFFFLNVVSLRKKINLFITLVFSMEALFGIVYSTQYSLWKKESNYNSSRFLDTVTSPK